jgi:hypothetical protein
MISPPDPSLPRWPSAVLTLLLIGAAIGWLMWRLWRSWSAASRLAAAGTALADRIAEARATAVTTGETVTLESPQGGRLANGVRWDVPTGRAGDEGDANAITTTRVEFRPDGTATAAVVRLRIENRRLVIPLQSIGR